MGLRRGRCSWGVSMGGRSVTTRNSAHATPSSNFHFSARRTSFFVLGVRDFGHPIFEDRWPLLKCYLDSRSFGKRKPRYSFSDLLVERTRR
jgi:hypothetical protein